MSLALYLSSRGFNALNPRFPRHSVADEFPCATNEETFQVSDNEEQYKTYYTTTIHNGLSHVILYSTLDQTFVEVPRVPSSYLAQCLTFQTLDEHLQAISVFQKADNDNRNFIRDALAGFVRKGILTARSAVRSDLIVRTPPVSLGKPRLETLGIPTCGRPISLRRCISSYLENLTRAGRKADLIIADNSASEDDANETLAVLTDVKSRFAIDVYYAGLPERHQYVKRFAAWSGLPEEVLAFALFIDSDSATSAGACRNTLLLQSCGKAFLSVDDDTVCDIRLPKRCQEGLAITSSHDPTVWRFGPNLRTLEEQAVVCEDVDVFGIHEQLLGESVSTLLKSEASNLDLDGLVRGAILSDHSETSVRVTSMGVLGDSAQESPLHYFEVNFSSVQELIGNEEAYRAALLSRHVLRHSLRRTVTEGAFTMTINMAFDNRQLLPPFMPAQRNQDGLFGATLRACSPGDVIGVLPWVLSHIPNEHRMFSRTDLWKGVGRLRTCDLLIALICSCSSTIIPGDQSRSLQYVGRYLQDLGSARQNTFRSVIGTVLSSFTVGWMREADARLRGDTTLPGFYATDLLHCVDICRDALRDGRYLSLRDLPPGEEGWRRLQYLVSMFGRLLETWPTIMEAARDFSVAKESIARVL